jgi:hypothetical protein
MVASRVQPLHRHLLQQAMVINVINKMLPKTLLNLALIPCQFQIWQRPKVASRVQPLHRHLLQQAMVINLINKTLQQTLLNLALLPIA